MGERGDNGLGQSASRRRARWAIMAAGSLLAGTAVVDTARAQSPDAYLLSPTLDADAGNPPSFSGSSTRQVRPPNRFQRILTDGNAPASGAGQSGFTSTTPPASSTGPASDLAAEAVPAPADDVETPAPQGRRRRPATTEDPYEPLGLRLGSFIVKPAVELSGGYDTNPERALAPRGGGVLVVSPELLFQSDWSRHQLRGEVRGRYTTYPGFQATPSLSQPFIDSKLAARIDVTRRTRIDLEGRFLLSTENPDSPDLPAGLARLPITTTGGVTAGVAHRFNRLELGVSGNYDRVLYGNSTLTSGAIVGNDDRNYHQYGGKLRGSYELVPGVKPFVEVGADRRVHDLAVDSSGLRRDSTGNEIRIGTTFELTRQLTGSASVGYATRRYQDPALSNLSGVVADGSLAWMATPLTTVTFTAQSQIAESTLIGVSGVLRRDLGVQVDHSLRRWLIGTVKFSYGLDDYVGSPREDQRYALSGQLTYKLSRNVQLKGEVRRQWLRSNIAGADYTADTFLLGVRLQQ